jgi:hypothetical protein
MDGRVLFELLEGGPEPESMVVTPSESASSGRIGPSRARQVARYSEVLGHRYLDQIGLSA